MLPKLQLKKFIITNASLLNILANFSAIYEITKQIVQNISNTINEQILSCTPKCHIWQSAGGDILAFA